MLTRNASNAPQVAPLSSVRREVNFSRPLRGREKFPSPLTPDNYAFRFFLIIIGTNSLALAFGGIHKLRVRRKLDFLTPSSPTRQ